MNSPQPPPIAQQYSALACLTALSYRSGDLGAYLTEIVLSVSRLIQADWTIVTLTEGDIGQVIASSLHTSEADGGFSVHGTLANEVVQSGRSLIIEDSRRAVQYPQPSEEYPGYLGVPLRTPNRKVIGTICSFLREPRPFTESEVKIVELFAERAAIANYQLYQQQLQFNVRLSQEVAACSIDLQRSQEKLLQRERLAAIGQFTAMIVHEVRNPLTTIQMGLTYAQKVLTADADQERLSLAASEAQRLNRLLNEILCYAKPQALELEKLNISEFLNTILMEIQVLPEAAERHVNYEQGLSKIEVMADPNKLRQVFLNLFRNAFEAIAPYEIVHCFIRNDLSSGPICISINNGGQPIPPELLPQIATPFCSTKPSGTGLGLAISKQIIIAHGGELEIESTGAGTTVSVYLPVIAADKSL